MTFGNATLLWTTLLAPFAAILAAYFWRRRLQAQESWASNGLWPRLGVICRRRRQVGSVMLLALSVLGAALALGQPRWGSVEEEVERSGVDIVFVLDSSLSMAAQDAKPSRFHIAQVIVRRLVRALPGHRVALVQAEGDGIVLAPLTIDTAVMDLLLDTVQPGTGPTPGTKLAPSIEAATELFPPGSDKHRTLVVISDGEDHGGRLGQLSALLERSGIVTHCLGVGSTEGVPIPLPETGTLQYKKDSEGDVVITRLSEDALENLSRASGGLYLRVTSAAEDLTPILEAIAGMERRTFESETLISQAERFQWPLAASICSLMLFLGWRPFQGTSENELGS